MPRSAAAAVAPLLIPALLSMVAVSTGVAQTPWPTERWPGTTPEVVGLSSATLDSIDAEIRAGEYGYVDRFLVIRNGQLAYDRRYHNDYDHIYGDSARIGTLFLNHHRAGPYNYFNPWWHPYYRRGDLHTLQSVTKTITSIVVGTAVTRNEFPSLDTPVLSFFDADTVAHVDDRKRRMTVRHLLTMTVGLDWNEDETVDHLESSYDWVRFTIDRPMADEPGTRFNYNSGASQLLSHIFRDAIGSDIEEYAARHLFAPLGITDWFWKRTPAGLPDTEGGLYLTPEDLAKLWFLFLRDGVWDGQEVVSPEWVRASVAPAIAVDDPSRPSGVQYGLKWWLHPNPTDSTRFMWLGSGFGGQFPIAIPEHDLIVVINQWNILPSEPWLIPEPVVARILRGLTDYRRSGLVPSAAPDVPDTVHVAPPTGDRETDRASILTALGDVEAGGTVQFASGTYLIGEIVRVTVPHITLLGHPDGTSLRGCDPAEFVDRQFVRENCNGLELAEGHQTVRGFTFEYAHWALHLGCCQGERAMLRAPDGSFVEGPAIYRTDGGHVVEGNTFRRSNNGIRMNGDWTEPAIVRNNRFIDNWHSVSINGNTVHLLDNDFSVPEPERVPFYGFPWDAVKIGPPLPLQETDETLVRACAHNIVAGNRIDGSPDGIRIEIYEPGTSCRRNVIRDNTITVRRVRAPAPERWFTRSDESDSTFVGIPIALLNYPEAFGQNEPGRESFLEDNLIEGNRIIGADGLGFEVLHASRNRIVNNTISRIAERDPFPGNALGPRGETGALEWREADGAGIWLSPGSDENEIVGNIFEDIASYAVVLEGDRNRVEIRGGGDAVRDVGSGNRVMRAGHPTAHLEALYRARTDSARTRYSAADVRFMSGMIAHHAQAIVMSRLAPSRDASPAVRLLAERIINAQEDEIALLQQWLRERGQPVPEVDLTGATRTAHGPAHAAHAHGMLTGEQLRELEAATAREFDRLFLESMIRHHLGAITMVDELFSTDAAEQDPAVSRLAAAIHSDQAAEIVRMQRMLAELSLTGRIR